MSDEKQIRPVAVRINNASGNIIGKLEVKGDADAVILGDGAKGNVIGEIEHVAPSDQTKEDKDGNGGPDDHWYKKPIGIVGLAVAGTLISAAAIWAIKHYL